ncbi:MAG: tRNA pseudouridine(55) synthase TruB [Parasporobacterium sp.]|nr:tRNA pseudouridine(55) synthase TruB [Parasporobacterium sp.]
MKYGVINVYKEAGMTSFQVVYRIRKLSGEKKIGHTGTLDPDATGVLPVCIGKATKLVDFLMDSDKQYKACMIFGKKTDTQDTSGTVLEEMDDKTVRERLKDPERIKEAFTRFTGTIEQLPPMYSAVKVDGVKLVDAARKGREIARKKRPVTVYGFQDITVSGLDKEEGPVRVTFTTNCSKGTYIRTLCEDIGGYLGVPSCMEQLERTRTSGLDLSTAKTLSEIEAAKEEGSLESLIIPTDHFLLQYPELTVKDDAIRKLVYGNYLSEAEIETPSEPLSESVYRIYDNERNFYALYRFDKRDRKLKCDKMFIEEP